MNRYDLVILGFLNEKEHYGYEIKTYVEDRDLHKWANISISTLYHRLNWLSKHEYIVGREEQVGNRPKRTSYQITDKGTELLHSEIKEFIGGFNDDPRMLALAHLHCIPPKAAVKAIEAHADYLREEIKTTKAMIRRNSPSELSALGPLLNKMSLDHLKIELKYMEEAAEILKDSKKARKIKFFFAMNE